MMTTISTAKRIRRRAVFRDDVSHGAARQRAAALNAYFVRGSVRGRATGRVAFRVPFGRFSRLLRRGSLRSVAIRRRKRSNAARMLGSPDTANKTT